MIIFKKKYDKCITYQFIYSHFCFAFALKRDKILHGASLVKVNNKL